MNKNVAITMGTCVANPQDIKNRLVPRQAYFAVGSRRDAQIPCSQQQYSELQPRSDGEAEKEGMVLAPYDGLPSSLTGRAS